MSHDPPRSFRAIDPHRDRPGTDERAPPDLHHGEAVRRACVAQGGQQVAVSPDLAAGPRRAVVSGGGSYGAAKAGLVAWNASRAGQLAATGGTASIIAPGYVTDTEFFGEQMSPERHGRLVDKTLLGRAGRPDDIAGAAAFLASEDAAWITGQVLHVNGGALLSR